MLQTCVRVRSRVSGKLRNYSQQPACASFSDADARCTQLILTGVASLYASSRIHAKTRHEWTNHQCELEGCFGSGPVWSLMHIKNRYTRESVREHKKHVWRSRVFRLLGNVIVYKLNSEWWMFPPHTHRTHSSCFFPFDWRWPSCTIRWQKTLERHQSRCHRIVFVYACAVVV